MLLLVMLMITVLIAFWFLVAGLITLVLRNYVLRRLRLSQIRTCLRCFGFQLLLVQSGIVAFSQSIDPVFNTKFLDCLLPPYLISYTRQGMLLQFDDEFEI